VALLERLTALQPDNPDAQFLLGLDRFHAGHPAEAIEALKMAARVNPQDNESNFYLGLCYLALDRNDEAEKAFERMAAQAPANVDELYLLIKAYTQVSSALLSRLVAVGKDSYRTHQVKGEYFDMQHASDAAIKEYEKAVELRPGLPSLHYVLANAYYKHSQLDKAVGEFRRTIELNPHHFMAHYTLGLLFLEEDDSANAIKELRAALADQPGLVGGYLALGKALFRHGDDEAAIPLLERHIQLVPDNAVPHYLLYQIYRRQHKPEDAAREMAIFQQKDQKAKEKDNKDKEKIVPDTQ
jgi:tetratricopeptide (TPR) repeat protein